MVVIISGKQGSGKTTLARKLKDYFGMSAICTRFADPLYEIHNAAQNVLLKYGLNKYVKKPKDGALLQRLGDWGRQDLHQDIWVMATLGYVSYVPKNTIVIIEDCRFRNELDMTKQMFAHERGCISVRLSATEETRKLRCEAWRSTANHISETDLDEYELNQKFDIIVDVNKFDEEAVFGLMVYEIKERLSEYGYKNI